MGKMSESAAAAAAAATAVIDVRRPVYQVEDLLLADGYRDADAGPTVTGKHRKKPAATSARLRWSDAKTVVPSIDWLFAKYNWADDFFKDFVAGFTVAVLNIPQGMAYAMLGNVEPTVGLYMAIVPVIVYSLLGTSRHVSMGSFSVICLMTGKVVNAYATTDQVGGGGGVVDYSSPSVSSSSGTDALAQQRYTPIEVATAVTLMVGLVQILMYVFRLGAVCAVLSETLVSGFTAGAAVHVVTSQMKELLGVEVDAHNGMFQIVLTYYDIGNRIRDVNLATVAVSCVTVSLLLAYNLYLKAVINKRLWVPVPIELITIVVGTALSQFTTFAADYRIRLIGEIAQGLPEFRPPPANLLVAVISESVVIAIVAYTVTMSMALLFAEKLRYPIDTNQELLALGAGNVVGSFFSCMPFAASLSRSATQHSVGGRTQMAGLVSSALLVAVVLWIGQLFQPLPRCVLASITVVALRDILLQAGDVARVWRASRADAAVWLVTYLTVVLVEIDVGLLAGVGASLLFVFGRGSACAVTVLGRVPDTDLYVDVDRHRRAVEVPRVRVVRYAGSLNLTNRNAFRKKMHAAAVDDRPAAAAAAVMTVMADGGKEDNTAARARCVVLDLSGMHYADTSGLAAFARLVDGLNEAGLSVYVAAPSGDVYDCMRSGGAFGSVTFFPSVHDAVEYFRNQDHYRRHDRS